MSESVLFTDCTTTASSSTVEGFKTVYKTKTGGRPFSALLDKVSQIDPEMRIRFTSPHPKDFPHEVSEYCSFFIAQVSIVDRLIIELFRSAAPVQISYCSNFFYSLYHLMVP